MGRAALVLAASTACALGCRPGSSDTGAAREEAVGQSSAAFTTWPKVDLSSSLDSIDSDGIAVAIDAPSDDVHVAFAATTQALGRQLYYGVRKASGSWQLTPLVKLDTQGFVSGTSVSITVDRDHFAHILYNHVLHDGLIYRGQLRHLAGPYFQVDEDVVEDSTATAQLEVGSANAITADSGGDLHIAYISKDNGTGHAQLTYAHQVWDVEGWHWRKDVIIPYSAASNLVRQIDIAVDGSKKPHIVFEDSAADAIAYVKNDGTPTSPSWNRDTVLGGLASDFFSHPSIAVNSSGVPSIAFASQTKKIVGVARLVGTTWNVDQAGPYNGTGRTWTSLVFEGGTIEQITSFSPSDTSVQFYRREGAAFNRDLVDNSAEVGRYGGSAVDSHGKPHVIYYDTTNKKLRHATAM
jgi:hypothetical protein